MRKHFYVKIKKMYILLILKNAFCLRYKLKIVREIYSNLYTNFKNFNIAKIDIKCKYYRP